MKKFSYMIGFVLIIFFIGGCGSSSNSGSTDTDSNDSGGQEDVTIQFLNFKVEIAEQLTRMIEEYEDLNPNVEIKLETVGGGADSAAILKTKFNSGNEPDIFLNGGYKELDLWLDNLENLSDESWATKIVDVAKEPMTKDGQLYGQPLNLEGYGFIYNKDLFEEAGITELPKTLDELEEVAIALENAGITAFVNGYGEWWVLGNHLANLPFALQEDPNAFIDQLDNGTTTFVENETFVKWVDLIDLTLKYGNNNPLQTDYNTQLSDFATGKAAITQQGNWIQTPLNEINPDINVGILPMPINNDGEEMDKMPIGVPYSWVIHKNSDGPVKEESKKFLDWMINSDIGRTYMTEEFKHIPVSNEIEASEETLGQLSAEVMRYVQEDKVLTWNWFKFPNGEATSHYFSDAMQAYIQGELTKEEMLESFQQSWDDLNRE